MSTDPTAAPGPDFVQTQAGETAPAGPSVKALQRDFKKYLEQSNAWQHWAQQLAGGVRFDGNVITASSELAGGEALRLGSIAEGVLAGYGFRCAVSGWPFSVTVWDERGAPTS